LQLQQQERLRNDSDDGASVGTKSVERSPVQPRKRRSGGFQRPTPDPPRASRHRWTLSGLPEARVLKSGVIRLRQLRDRLGSSCCGADCRVADELDLPRRPDGTPLVVRAAFLRRLLTEELELKVCMGSDVSAAQTDLGHLSLEQLLSLRAATFDSSTDSDSHEALRDFLSTLDAQLFAKLARHCLQKDSSRRRLEHVRLLGGRMLLVLGAIEELTSGEFAQKHDRTLPESWAVKLDETAWSGCSVAIFNTAKLWLEVVPEDNLDRLCQVCAGPVAMVRDHSTGAGASRSLHWEVTAMNPQTDDILSEVAFSEGVGMRELSTELSAAIKQRCASNARVLGLQSPRRSSDVGGLQSPPRFSDAGGLSTTPKPYADDTSTISHANRGRVASEISRINSAVEESSPVRRLVYGGPASPEGKRPWRHSTGGLQRSEVSFGWSPATAKMVLRDEQKEVLPRELVLEAWKERRRLENGLPPERHCSVDVLLEDREGSFEWPELLPCCCGRSPHRTAGNDVGLLQGLLGWMRTVAS